MMRLNFSGDGEVLGSTTPKYNQPLKRRKMTKKVVVPEVAPEPVEKLCSWCMRTRVYGVSTCLCCLRRIGSELVATIACYPFLESISIAVDNLKLVVAEMEKYGVVPSPKWEAAMAAKVRRRRDAKVSELGPHLPGVRVAKFHGKGLKLSGG